MAGIRFAPSPTGRFHVGNLRTAWIAALWARALGAPLVVRFEDIDAPRVIAGAQETQLADMAALGLRPDLVQIQSEFRHRHFELFQEAVRGGQLYPCDCSRKDVRAEIQSAPNDGQVPVYSGRCRHRGRDEAFNAENSLAWRFRTPEGNGIHDFIVARTADLELDAFVPSYHWACAIDDYDGRFTLLVRGIDLAQAARLQRLIQTWLGELEDSSFVPSVFHASLVVSNDGGRLEKRTRGITLPELQMSHELVLKKFEASFDASALSRRPAPGEILEESRPRLRLGELGF